jgi:hypothetical protein
MSHRRQADARPGAYSDPFADPFFGGGLDPIAAMMQQQQQMMSNMSQMMGGMGGMFGGLGGMGMMGMAHPMLMNESTPRSRQQQPAHRPSHASSGPIVEEPDAEPSAATHYRSGLDMTAPSLASFSSTSFSSSSFSSSSGSGGPVYFQSSTSTVKGPNGTFTSCSHLP